jgi:flagellar motor switch protein FliN/FliY
MANILEEKKLNIVLDVKVQLTARLGSCQMAMRDVLELAPGVIIQLDQRANDPIGICINDKLIAVGEVVVLEENFCIKITELIGDKL